MEDSEVAKMEERFFELVGMAEQRQAEDDLLRSVGRDRLVELAQAERDGRLVVLPCKVGDTIYKVVKCCGKQSGFCFHASCDQSHDQCQYWIATVVEEKVEDVWDMSEVIQHLGETIFLTRQEAEAAVEHAEGD